MSQTRNHQPPQPMRALRATYDEARAGREAAQALAPLLSLLDPAEAGESPLQEVTDLLEAILRAQEETLRAIQSLSARLDGIERRRP